MKLFQITLFFTCISVTFAGKKLNKMKGDIVELEEKFASVLNDTTGSIEELESAIEGIVASLSEMRAAQAQKDIDLAWQALHMSGAAACRGSAPNGGKGDWANSVIPKENGKKCDDQCKLTDRPFCRAEVAVSGYPGRATDYTQIVGYFYNYECNAGANTDINHNEVAAEDGDLLTAGSSDESSYYRFCCCARN